jgi:hypothetical protein
MGHALAPDGTARASRSLRRRGLVAYTAPASGPRRASGGSALGVSHDPAADAGVGAAAEGGALAATAQIALSGLIAK